MQKNAGDFKSAFKVPSSETKIYHGPTSVVAEKQVPWTLYMSPEVGHKKLKKINEKSGPELHKSQGKLSIKKTGYCIN